MGSDMGSDRYPFQILDIGSDIISKFGLGYRIGYNIQNLRIWYISGNFWPKSELLDKYNGCPLYDSPGIFF